MRSPERSRPSGTEIVSARPPLAPTAVVLLAGLSLLLVFLALEPLLSYALFGSDSGEYYRLTTTLLASGHLPTSGSYTGWGTAYPDFPGMFVVAGGASGALGISAYSALTILVPVVAVLSVLPLFLLFRRLYPNDTVALLGAAIASIAMPRLFSIAHPAPLALGDFLCVAALWMFVEGRQDRRWYVPLALTSGALIVTHHLSSYFFVISALGGLVLLELWRPGVWSRRFPARELTFLALFLTGTFAYWFYGTTSFVTKVILESLPFPTYVGFAAFEVGGLVAVGLAGVVLRWRRTRTAAPRDWVRLPTDKSLVRDAAAIVLIVFGLVAVLLVVPIPGTGQRTVPGAVLWFSPLLALGLFGAGARRTPALARLGSFPLAWLGALGLSAGTMLAFAAFAGTNPKYAVAANLAATLSPARHVEYLFLPLGIILAIGIGRAIARVGDARGRRVMLAAALGVVVLLGANAAIVYPPASDLGGFQEGLTHGDAALWMWVGIAIPSVWTVASDHRLSSMIFGVDGNPATWVTTPALFNGGSNSSVAAAELRSVGTPNPADPHPIDLGAVDSVMHQGVALDPAQEAAPLSGAALVWFEGLPFLPLYEDGQNVVYLVDGPAIPAAL
jgi:hypothetical protein